jgi:opacity protein-like surface antigen
VGGGVELALSPNWSIRSEYLFVDITGPDSLLNTLPGEPLATINTTHELKQHIGQVALNYKFDWVAEAEARTAVARGSSGSPD